MSGVYPVKRRRIATPTAPVPIAKTEIADKLEFAYLGYGVGERAYDHVQSLLGVAQAGVEFQPSRGILLPGVDQPSARGVLFADAPFVDQSRPFTAFVTLDRTDNDAGSPVPFSIHDPDADSNFVIAIDDPPATSWTPWYCGSGSGAGELEHIRPTVGTEVPQTGKTSLCVVYDGVAPSVASSFTMYFNGIDEGELGSAGSIIVSNITEMGVGVHPASAFYRVSGFLPVALFWRRALSAAEVLSIYQNSHQVLAPRTIWMPLDVAAAVGASKLVVLNRHRGM